MGYIIISAVATLLGIGGGITFSKPQTKGTRFIIWGAITLFIFSWATMTFIGGLLTYVVKDGLILVPFWIFGTPALGLIGLIFIIVGFYMRSKHEAHTI